MTGQDPGLVAFVEAATRASSVAMEPLAGDGSSRRILRARSRDLTWIAVANRLPRVRAHPDENEAFIAIARFLAARGVRVPAVLAADLERGYLLLEDLGDTRLFEVVAARGWGAAGRAEAGALYDQAIDHLLRMQQAGGSPAFDPSWVSHPSYSEDFIIEKEARYFHEEMVAGFAGLDLPFSFVLEECRSLARAAMAGLDAPAFVHRDYQSRNLMVPEGRVAVIDFQGGRLGPPEYDLAALLFDPYAAIPPEERDRLVERYRRAARPDRLFRERFTANAANRMMQALGAFAKLGGREKRPGFLTYVPAALATLDSLLDERGGASALRQVVLLTRGAVEGRCK